jgi:hypothetical protein
MRKLVILIVALLALFTFIRDYPSATPNSAPNSASTAQAEAHSSLIP